MRRFLLLILPLACASAWAADVKSDLQAKYNELASAFAKRDPAPYEALLAKDYVLHLGSQTRDRDYIMKDFKRQMGLMSNVKWVRKVTAVKAASGAYVATVKSVFEGDFDMSGKKSHFWNSGVSDDTWVQEGKAWQLKSSNLVSLDAKIDGKPAGHFPAK
jgi:hypothetical protein